MAFSEIDPARLDGDALTRWYLRSPADIEQERQQAAAQKYQDFFGGDAPDELPVATPQRGTAGRGNPQFGLIPDAAASPMTVGANGNYQLAAASRTPAGDWICQACHGRSVLPPPPPTLYTPPRDPGGATPYPGGGGPSGKNPKQCVVQYENDSNICRWVPGVDARRRCWESAARREAHCNETKGEVGYPDLITR
jgi:hypothetical protein